MPSVHRAAAQPVEHAFAPVFDERSRVLILGTMPSPGSRKYGFYYSHPQNHFWPVMAALFGAPQPVTPEEKRAFVLARGIALWDVLQSCRIVGADDSTIRDPRPNDFSMLLATSDIQAVFTTGTKATQLYRRFCEPALGIPTTYLPSTSPANCRNYSFATMTQAYRALLPYLMV